MPSTFLLKFESDSTVNLFPLRVWSALLSGLKRSVCQGDESGLGDGVNHISMVVQVDQNGFKLRVRFDGFRKSWVAGVIAVYSDLIRSIVGEVECNHGMSS